jgi:hypothetical protein
MRRLFKQKYILRIIAFLTLALAIFNVSEPKIREYNWNVYEEQQRLQIEANGVNNRKISFGFSHHSSTVHQTVTFFSALLFLSLVLTKRIILSFVFLLVFWLQIYLTRRIVLGLNKAEYYFPYPENLYFEYFITGCLVVLSFWLAFSVCNFFSQRFQIKTFLK